MTFLEGLQWIAPICGVIGFIISPGLTVIYPWLREKFNKDLKTNNDKLLERDIEILEINELEDHYKILKKQFRFDWRPKVIKVRRKIKRNLKSKGR